MAIDFKDLEKQIEERGRIQTLDNGITLITENVPGSGLVQGNIEISAGAGHETDEDHGIMHFLEHVIFGPSILYPNRDDRSLQSSLLGLRLNANTGHYQINYPIQGANSSQYILQENFLESFRIISEMTFSPNINEESLQREMSVVQRERIEHEQKNAAKPFYDVTKTIGTKVYGNNPLFRKEILGTEESISRITVPKLREYHSNFFVGNNLLVQIAGDLNSGIVLEDAIKDELNKVPKGNKAKNLDIMPEKSFNGRERLDLVSPVKGNAIVEIYFQLPPSHNFDAIPMDLLSYILGSSNGLLFQDIREERGLVYSIGSQIEGHRKTGLLKIGYGVEPKHLDESLQAVDDNIQKLKEGKFDARLVDAYVAATLPGALYSFQNPGWIYNELNQRHGVEKLGFESSALQRLQTSLNLNKKDVVNAANQYLGEDRLTVIVK